MRAQPTLEREGCALFVADDIVMRTEDIESVFRWLGTWDMIVPLRPYNQLATSEGTPEERVLTALLVLDLRQPLYDPRILAARQNVAFEAFCASWDNERERCSCSPQCGLPFLRAVWFQKPLLLAAPQGWVTEGSL